jgi:outer membrane lipoprotein-sorting protein
MPPAGEPRQDRHTDAMQHHRASWEHHARTRTDAATARTRRHPPVVAVFATVALLVSVALNAAARAQTLSVDEVLTAIETTAAALDDVSFMVVGTVFDEVGQRIAIEIEAQLMPNDLAANLYIVQPAALADNQLVIDGEVLRNYTYLTNQVSVFDRDDPDALGGLLPEAAGATIDLNLARVFANWDASLDSVEPSPAGDRYTIRFDTRDPDGQIHHVLTTVVRGEWLPVRLVFYLNETDVLADLEFVDMVRDQGLTRTEVVYIPEDAETIDRRRR